MTPDQYKRIQDELLWIKIFAFGGAIFSFYNFIILLIT